MCRQEHGKKLCGHASALKLSSQGLRGIISGVPTWKPVNDENPLQTRRRSSQDLMMALGASVLESCSETDRHSLNRHGIGKCVKMAFGCNSMKSHRLIQVAVKALTEKNDKWHGQRCRALKKNLTRLMEKGRRRSEVQL